VQDNRLLAALPTAQVQRLLPWLEPVDVPLGHVLCESGNMMSHVYFPTTGLVSLLYVTEDGAPGEIALVGCEGVVGVALFMGGDSTPSRAVAYSAGKGLRLAANVLKREFDLAGPLMHVLLRYTQALITQISQTAVCNRHHSIDQQLCRCLLLCLDRLAGNEIVMTQELIAHMLGVRREGVTEGALKLQRAGLIRYRRGHITVLDRAGLERRSCECYAVVRHEYDRLLTPGRPLAATSAEARQAETAELTASAGDRSRTDFTMRLAQGVRSLGPPLDDPSYEASDHDDEQDRYQDATVSAGPAMAPGVVVHHVPVPGHGKVGGEQ
jgi:CRP-like cAMP-binding protein